MRSIESGGQPIRRLRFGILLLASMLMLGCAHSPVYDPHDPFEEINRDIYAFNVTLDHYVLRPTARTYVRYTPELVRTGVDNFLTNFFYPRTMINSLLQGKIIAGGQDLGRFLVNSTIGLLGIFDVATPLGIPKHNEDFGQTLGHWGLGHGAYLMLPVLGPSTGRDFSGRIVDIAFTSTTYINSEPAFVITVADIINLRAKLLRLDRAIEEAFDPYSFVRGSYLQNRRTLLYDGNPPSQEAQYTLDEGDATSSDEDAYDEAFDDVYDEASE
ncbi:MAG: VacJ family lipoprotein [Salinisphaeraceae bacterium]|nr:VacJ family lipoprotein [Salinisphaeraceae bacterium]